MGGRRYRSSITGPTLFFATTTAENHFHIFDTPDKLSSAEAILFKVVHHSEASLYGYVIMPNHIHVLILMKDGGKQLSTFMHSLKGNIRKALYGDVRIWQQRFDDLIIKTEEQFAIKLNYMHWNPVKRNLVKHAEEWPFSSYRFWTNQEEHPILVRNLEGLRG
jgi:putative transposase